MLPDLALQSMRPLCSSHIFLKFFDFFVIKTWGRNKGPKAAKCDLSGMEWKGKQIQLPLSRIALTFSATQKEELKQTQMEEILKVYFTQSHSLITQHTIYSLTRSLILIHSLIGSDVIYSLCFSLTYSHLFHADSLTRASLTH